MSRMNGKKTHTHTTRTIWRSSAIIVEKYVNSSLQSQLTGCEIHSLVLRTRKKGLHLPHAPCIERCVAAAKLLIVLFAFFLCLCVFSSHLFWTSSSLDVPAGVTQEEGHTGFLIHLPSAVRALIFVARRIQPFLSLVDREVEFCVLTN